jgi:hypothetical protein
VLDKAGYVVLDLSYLLAELMLKLALSFIGIDVELRIVEVS